MGVLVGGTSVSVGSGVSVGGTGVAVGGMDVGVAGGGMGVGVAAGAPHPTNSSVIKIAHITC